MGKNYLDHVPPASSLIDGMRAMGYNFSTALADIIDNSISAGAKNIDIDGKGSDSNTAYLSIIDDGCGMTNNELLNAMTFGMDRTDVLDSEKELGRFGLGLKSASLSQCRELIVVSKKCGRINAYSYDLDYLKFHSGWKLIEYTDVFQENFPGIEKLNSYDTGTIVIWKKFDKLKVTSDDFQSSFLSCIKEAKQHIELVFHLFSDINIRVFGNKIEKRDPFLSNSKRTQISRPSTIILDNNKIEVHPYVLPFISTFTNKEKELLGTGKKIVDNSGFYIYRNKRLIVWGTWLRMGIRGELNKLTRIKIEIPSSLDKQFNLDVKKSSARIPDKIKDELYIDIKDSVVRSEKTVTHRGLKEEQECKPIWIPQRNSDGKKYVIDRETPLAETIYSRMDYHLRQMFDSYLNKIEDSIPKGQIYNDNISNRNILNSEDNNDDDKLIEDLKLFALAVKPEERKDSIHRMLSMGIYKKIAKRENEILKDLIGVNGYYE